MGFGQIRVNLFLLLRDAGCRPIKNSEIALQARTILPKHRGCAEHEMNREGARRPSPASGNFKKEVD